MKQEFNEQEYRAIQEKYFRYCEDHPDLTTTEKFIALNRLYEKAHFGVTSRDLARGYEIEYDKQPNGKTVKLKNSVHGRFIVGGDGNRGVGADPVAQYTRTRWEPASGELSEITVNRDKEVTRHIALAASEHLTSTDILTTGDKLLDHRGIDTGFGGATGVIAPEYVNMLLEKAGAKAMFKNFANIVPMPSMTFYYPLKVSSILDNADIAAATYPTKEGYAGTEFAISYDKWLVNGWKYLRHAGLSVELIQMLSRFINVRGDYINDMRDAMTLLWDFTIAEGLWSMMTTAKWRRPESGGATWSDEEFVPLSAAGTILTGAGNAKKYIVYQNLKPDSLDYGLIYEAADSANHLKFQSSTLRPGSEVNDDLYELIVAMGTMLKNNRSKMEFFMAPPIITEYFMRDSRFLDMTMSTGNPAFQGENGYLGQISIGGSSQKVDVWEYETDVLGAKATTDTVPIVVYPVFAGAYNRFWNMGIFSPTYMRVDDGMEVKAVGTGGVDVIRPNETRVITVGSRGSSFPGDMHHLVLGLINLTVDHT